LKRVKLVSFLPSSTMKTSLFVIASIVSAANAFAPSKAAPTRVSLSESKADLESLAQKLNPAVKFFDPLSLADDDFWDMGNAATVGWLRQAEIKHGRIAMFAFVGYCVQSNFVFPWAQTLAGAPHPSADLSPEAQWDAIPDNAKWQIFGIIGLLEFWDEMGGGGELPHYTNGRQPGKYPSFQNFRNKVHPVLNLYDPFGVTANMAPDVKEKRLVAEINNGRLAMLGIFGFICENKISGSVPLLSGLGAAPGYSGEPMAPFEGSFSLFGH
jgi:hypothetical protein